MVKKGASAFRYDREVDLCTDFIAAVQDMRGDPTWDIYPETRGFDILLSRKADGLQIGIEAKLRLNVEVVCQALPHRGYWNTTGPDHRAVLVPSYACQNGIAKICDALGITAIRYTKDQERYRNAFQPYLPAISGDFSESPEWHHWMPTERLKLPDYVPDVVAGSSAPVQLTDWKIKAIKIAIILERRPVTRADFKAIEIDPSRWLDPHHGWLMRTESGYVAGDRMPDFKGQHPVNYEQIKADAAKWMPSPAKVAVQKAML